MPPENEVIRAARAAIDYIRKPVELTQEEIDRCHVDFDFFAERIFIDDDKKPVRQAPHHRHLQAIMTGHRRTVTLYPVGFGKTTQITMRILWELGLDPTLRIIVVSSKGSQSAKVIGTVAREMASNAALHQVFPNLKPAIGAVRQSVDTWRGTALRVHGAPAGQKDPSVASYGLDGSVSGSRAEIVFGDNLMDFENTSSRHQRNKSIQRFFKEVMTRLVPKVGRVYITDTAWTKDDLPHELMKKERWFDTVFDAEINPFGEGVLWESRFPEDELENIKGEIGTLAYDLTYRNKPMSDSMGVFDETLCRAAFGKCRWMEEYRGPNRIITGVDLAVQAGQEHDMTVFTTVEDCGDTWRVINIDARRIQAGDIIRSIIDIGRRFHFNSALGIFIVENNAAQDYIVQSAKDAELMRGLGVKPEESSLLNVIGKTTTAQKRDLEFGIPRLAVDIEMGRWELPDHPEAESLIQEMMEWIPDLGHHSGDRLMSLWIARHQLAKAVPRMISL